MIEQRTASPRLAVVVASRDRPTRLRWLLNALEEQTLDRHLFEVIVAHDSAGPLTETMLSAHPLAAAGVLQHLTFRSNSSSPGAMRNAGWLAANAAVVIFTDDDCRPEPTWLAMLNEAAAKQPELSVLQGTTRPDPFETVLAGAPWARSVCVEPPDWHANTCNIAYPRSLLAELGGFDETFPAAAGEDTDLWARAEQLRAQLVAVPEAIINHAVEPHTLLGALGRRGRWMHLAFLFKRHRRLRRHLFLGIFWRRRHASFLLAAAAAVAARRQPRSLILVLPWALEAMPPYGTRPRQRLHAVVGLPARAIVDGYEFLTLIRGSWRYKTLFL